MGISGQQKVNLNGVETGTFPSEPHQQLYLGVQAPTFRNRNFHQGQCWADTEGKPERYSRYPKAKLNILRALV